jgi:hypothetical protein
MSHMSHILCLFIKHTSNITWGVQTTTLVLESWIGNQEKYRYWKGFVSVQIHLRQQLVTSTQINEIATTIFVNNSLYPSASPSRSGSHSLTWMSVQNLFVLGRITLKSCSFCPYMHRFSVHDNVFPHSLPNRKKVGLISSLVTIYIHINLIASFIPTRRMTVWSWKTELHFLTSPCKLLGHFVFFH